MRRPVRIVPASVVDKVLKLKELAAHQGEQGFPAEAEAAAAHALRIMREHCLEEADLAPAARAAEDPMEEGVFYLEGLLMVLASERSEARIHQVSGWKRQLALIVSYYLGLRHSFVLGTPRFCYYGRRSDVRAGRELYRICAQQIDRQCAAHLSAKKAERAALGLWWDAGMARTEAFAFKESAVSGLESKFEELKRESAAQHAQGHGLVLARKASVDEWFQREYLHRFKVMDTSATGAFGGDAGYSQEGWDAGRRLKLNDDDRSLDAGERLALPG